MKAIFIETSAITGENILNSFQILTKNILKMINEGMIDLNQKVIQTFKINL